MNKDLPPIQLIRLRNEVDRFGFSYVLSKKFGFAKVPRSFAAFLHGWIWRKDLRLDDLGYYFTPRNTPVIVTTVLQKEILLQNKFTTAVAGGLPFAYLDKSGFDRKKESLLIMPPHSIQECGYAALDATFLDYIQSIENEFSEICFCLHSDDKDNLQVTKSLRERGFDIIIGAHHCDANSLYRMRAIFDYYDYVTTNVMGSHILYAAFCGCRVSLLDKYFSSLPEQVFNNHSWRNNISGYVERSLDTANNIHKLKEQFPWLFVAHPKTAKQMIDWAKDEIGANNLLDKHKLMSLLGWTISSRIKALIRIAPRRFIGLFK